MPQLDGCQWLRWLGSTWSLASLLRLPTPIPRPHHSWSLGWHNRSTYIYPLVSLHSWLENPLVAHGFSASYFSLLEIRCLITLEGGNFSASPRSAGGVPNNLRDPRYRPPKVGAHEPTEAGGRLRLELCPTKTQKHCWIFEMFGTFNFEKIQPQHFFNIFQASILKHVYVNLGRHWTHLRQGGNRWIISWPCGGCETSCSAIGSVGRYFN